MRVTPASCGSIRARQILHPPTHHVTASGVQHTRSFAQTLGFHTLCHECRHTQGSFLLYASLRDLVHPLMVTCIYSSMITRAGFCPLPHVKLSLARVSYKARKAPANYNHAFPRLITSPMHPAHTNTVCERSTFVCHAFRKFSRERRDILSQNPPYGHFPTFAEHTVHNHDSTLVNTASLSLSLSDFLSETFWQTSTHFSRKATILCRATHDNQQ